MKTNKLQLDYNCVTSTSLLKYLVQLENGFRSKVNTYIYLLMLKEEKYDILRQHKEQFYF